MFFRYILPFLLPTLGFVLWTWLARRKEGRLLDRLANGPWFWLMISGVALTAVVLVATALTGGGVAGSRIIPPRLENGQVVPAEIVPPSDTRPPVLDRRP